MTPARRAYYASKKKGKRQHIKKPEHFKKTFANVYRSVRGGHVTGQRMPKSFAVSKALHQASKFDRESRIAGNRIRAAIDKASEKKCKRITGK